MRNPRIGWVVSLAMLLIGFHAASCSAQSDSAPDRAKPPESKNQTYRSLDGRKVIAIISSDELEIRQGGENLVCNYTEQDGKLRVVVNMLGTTMAEYYDITTQGLVDEDGVIYYTETVFQEIREVAEKQALAAKKIAAELDPKMVWIEGGTFLMGSPEGEEGRDADETQYPVELDGFWLAAMEVTQAQWEAVMGTNPSASKRQRRPVQMVSWEEAMEFCRKLSEKTGKTYTLPTEAQWEYACRAGTTTPWSTGASITTGQANFNSYATVEVGHYRPNAWGLYDMHGNVLEWCLDWYGDYGQSPGKNPTGPESGQYRVLRGGSWSNVLPADVRSADRSWNVAGHRGSRIGFRPARASEATEKQALADEEAAKKILVELDRAMVRIEGGTFLMGSPEGEEGRDADETQHRVELDGFWLAATEVTQEQWKAVMGTNPSAYKRPRRPVEMVSWKEAMEFCRKLSEKTGKTYTLPTEAQWEYACRAGTTTPWSTGASITTEQANFNGDATVEVGHYRPNAWGLYDMHGNVLEWCLDWYGDYGQSPGKNPTGPESGQYRVLRGGSWFDMPAGVPAGVRSAIRGRDAPEGRSASFGFRLARAAD